MNLPSYWLESRQAGADFVLSSLPSALGFWSAVLICHREVVCTSCGWA